MGKNYMYWDGMEDLEANLKRTASMRLVREIVDDNATELQEKMVKEAQFKRYTPMAPQLYSTGQTRRSIPTNFGTTDNGLTAYAGPTTEYASYVEYGTRKMRAQPFVRPAFDAQKPIFLSDLKGLVE